jgi:hypothetical protein
MTSRIQIRMMTSPIKPLITVPAAQMPGTTRTRNKAVSKTVSKAVNKAVSKTVSKAVNKGVGRHVTVEGMITAAAAAAAAAVDPVDPVEETAVGVRTTRKGRAVANGIPPQLPASRKMSLLQSHHLTKG